MKLKIIIGADHRGVQLKKKIVDTLAEYGHEVIDVGIFDSTVMCDYPKISLEVGTRVAKTKNSRGILVCMTGIGHSIAANKIRGVYAALCYTKEAAALSRQHNNANVLVLGSKFVTEKQIFDIIKTWLAAEFEGGRHLRRINQIKAMEKRFFKSNAK
jgi:RpiB/LacA/LacB family sugar-phosphate isomerase